MNLIGGDVAPDGIHIGDYIVPVPRDTLAKASDEKRLMLGIRPENFTLGEGEQGIGIDVAVVEELGADAFVYGTVTGLSDEERLTANQVTARIHGRTPPRRGETIRLQIDSEHVHVFSEKTGLRISPDQASRDQPHTPPPPPRPPAR
jgi:multiple sugar transport system ATP-binding protein